MLRRKENYTNADHPLRMVITLAQPYYECKKTKTQVFIYSLCDRIKKRLVNSTSAISLKQKPLRRFTFTRKNRTGTQLSITYKV